MRTIDAFALLSAIVLTSWPASAQIIMPKTSSSPFGDNVLVFDPGMDRNAMQARLDALHQQQKQAEFSDRRYALLFRPGDYELDITVDYYVQAAGLGQVPGDVRIHGSVQSTTTNHRGDVTTKFWRAAENFDVTPKPAGGLTWWAVSQAAPYRRMHVRGDIQFDKRRWASGGVLANSIIEGRAGLTTGQQWFTRNSEIGSWYGGNWNRTFIGTVGAPVDTWPSEPTTVIDRTPVIRDKPFLVVDDDQYFVFVPALQRSTRGVTWKSGDEPGRRISLDDFHIADPGKDTAATINAALGDGRHLLLTPGIYKTREPIVIEKPDTIVLGLGLATIIPQSGEPALATGDAPGISVSGVMVDAGPIESPVLIDIGPPGASARHVDNPVSLHDVYCRVGGAAPGKADTCLRINSHNVIVDHTWLWRADHGAGVGWHDNTSAHGLVVNGDDVTIYGLFNEHFQHYQTVWRGERGRTYFYQSEIPYDPPSQADWMNGSSKGFASYKVADSVSTHEAYGLGIYSFFNVRQKQGSGVRLESAAETPDGDGIRIEHITTFAGRFGGIDHVINGCGDPTNTGELNFYDGLNVGGQRASPD